MKNCLVRVYAKGYFKEYTYHSATEEIDKKLSQGWIVKFVNTFSNHIEYVLEKHDSLLG